MKIKVKTQFLLFFLAIILICNLNVAKLSSDGRDKVEGDVPSEALKHWDHGKLRISSNGHYLEHEDGTAFFWSGGTVWALFHRATADEARTYFEDRKSKGFSVIQACITGPGDHLGELKSKYNIVNGQVPFIDNDPEKPNENFFTYVDMLIDIAAENNLYMGLLPTWGEYVCDQANGGWGVGPRLFDTDSAYT